MEFELSGDIGDEERKAIARNCWRTEITTDLLVCALADYVADGKEMEEILDGMKKFLDRVEMENTGGSYNINVKEFVDIMKHSYRRMNQKNQKHWTMEEVLSVFDNKENS